jgi:hypothetical protein
VARRRRLSAATHKREEGSCCTSKRYREEGIQYSGRSHDDENLRTQEGGSGVNVLLLLVRAVACVVVKVAGS